MTTSALLSSGGMDSFLLAHHLRNNGIDAEHVFVDVGQSYAQKEEAAAMFVAASAGAKFHRMQGAQVARFEHPSGIIPFRNAELILNAAQYGDDIYLGVIADEVNSDKSAEFLHCMEQVLNESHRAQYWTTGRTFRLLTPLRDRSKTQLVREYLRAGGDVAVLCQTVSCYDGGAKHCGRCASCFKRWIALANNGVNVEDMFDAPPWYAYPLHDLRAKLDGYSDRRRVETVQALRSVGVMF